MKKIFKEYKVVAIIYLVLTIINVVWLVNYDRSDMKKQVKKTTDIVYKA